MCGGARKIDIVESLTLPATPKPWRRLNEVQWVDDTISHRDVVTAG
jgi:hypothetical protein